MNIKRIIKSTARWLTLIVAGFLLLTGILYGLVQTGPGKAVLAGSLQYLLSSGVDRHVRIKGISGHIPFHFRVENITVSHREGPWLVMKNSALDWNPFGILRGEIYIREWTTEEIDVGPVPGSGKGEKKGGTSLPSWPLAIPSFTLEKLLVERLGIHTETPGGGSIYSVKGSMLSSHPAHGLSGSLRIDQAGLSESFAVINWEVRGKEPVIKIDTVVQGMNEEIIRAVSGLRQTGPVDLFLTGEGPPGKWKGSLTIGSEKLGRVKSDLEFRIKKDLRLLCSGNLMPGPYFLPTDLLDLVQEKGAHFSLDLEYGAGGELLLHHLSMDNKGARVRMKGSLDLERGVVDSSFQIGIEDASLFKGILAGEPRGRLDLKGHLSGSLKNPQSELSLLISDPGFEDFHAEKMKLDLQAEISGKRAFAFHGLDIEGRAAVTGVRTQRDDFPIPLDRLDAEFRVTMEKGKPLLIRSSRIETQDMLLRCSGLFEPESSAVDGRVNAELADMGWLSAFAGRNVTGTMQFKGDVKAGLKTGEIHADLAGEVDTLRLADIPLPFERFRWDVRLDRESEGVVEIQKIGITTNGLSLAYTGTLDPDLLRMDGNADIRLEDFGLLSAGLGSAVTGKAAFQAGLKADLKAGDLSADLKGHIGEFQTIPAYLDPVKGGARFSGKVDLLRAERVRFSDMRVNSDVFQFTGHGSLNLKDQGITARAHLSVPGLHHLSGVVKKEIGGSMELDLEASGTYLNPEMAAEATVREVRVQDIYMPRARLSVHADHLAQGPRGDLALSLDLEDAPIHAKTGFEWKKESLVLRELTAEGPGIHMEGDLAMNVESLVTRGSLKIRADDLITLSSLWKEGIEGSVAIDAVFKKDEGGQDLVLSASGKRMAGLKTEVEEISITSSIHDLFGDPDGKVDLEMKGVHRGAVHLEAGKIEVQGGLSHMHYSANGSGTYGDPFRFQGFGAARFPGEEILFRLEQFEGEYRGYPLLLVQPVIIHKQRNHYRIEESYISLAGGSLRSSGEMSPESIAVEAVLKDLPLALLHVSGVVPDLKGSASADVRIGGTPEHPEAEATVRIRDIQSTDERYQHVPPAHSRIHISYGENRLKGDLTLEGLSKRPLEAEIGVPASFSLSPVSFSLGKKGEIRGRISADMNINRFPLFFNLEGQILEGNLRVDLGIAGNLEKPEIRGDVTLAQGRYENPGVGVVAKGIRLSGDIENDRFVLKELQAEDGGKGVLQAKGRILFHPDEGYPCHLELDLNKYALIRGDPFSIVTDADLTVSGSAMEAVLSGPVRVTSAELRIPDRLPTEIYEVEVIEINGPARTVQKKPDSEKKMAKRLKLDIGIEAPGRVFVRGRGLDSEWQGNLKVSGTAAEPSIRGDVSVVRGKYNFFGKIFSLSKGYISFPGGQPPMPRFDVTAEHQLPDMTARIRITGSPSAPDIQIESDPPLPEDEVLARLLFGRRAGAMTPFQALRLAQAVNAMRGGGGNIMSFFDRTRRLLGVDQLDIRRSDQNGGDTSLSAGKYVRENVYLEVEKGLDSESGKVSVEVELTPNVTVESEAGVDSGSGMGINWKWDY